ncbi:MAG: GAF domain-containing protein [Anaerolineaceae bacterium]|nr:MAG: GAF domain-containing protein [Anaerolineaceae bacterium]
MDDKTGVTDSEITNARNSLSLIRSQVKAGRIDQTFLARQVDRVDALLERIAGERASADYGGRFEALYNVSQMLGTSLDLQIVLDQVMDAIIRLTGAERGFLMLHDDDGGLNVKAARNFDQQTLNDADYRFSRTVVRHVLDSGTSLLTTNASEDPRLAGQASIVAQSLRSIMATPLRARGNVIGVVYVDSRITAGLFGDADLSALDAFSAQAAIALENALLFSATDQALNRRVDELRQLRRIDMTLNETLDIEKAVDFTLRAACKLAGAERGLIGLVEYDDATTHRIESVHYVGMDDDGAGIDGRYPELAEVIASGQSAITTAYIIVPVKRDQQVIGVLILLSDDRRFNEHQVDLVERVATRASVAIENGRLYAAVQRADRAKSEFVGVVAHDLKAPMTGIKGYADLLLMFDELSDSQADYLRKISATVDRMEMLVSDLADISRIESGYFFMDETLFHVADVVQALRDNVTPQIQARGHHFIEDVADDIPPIYGDYYRLLQVLTNLLSNAYKYTPDGGTITLNIRAEGGRVRFSVADTGIGLTPEQIAKLGTKFWRADDEYTRSQPGSGLGFAITRSLVEQMGDHITIHSEAGAGSTFTFGIPIKAAPDADDERR